MTEYGVSDVVDEFIAAIRAAGKPPCDGCKDEYPCRDNETACDAYAAYVDGEAWEALPRLPSLAAYAKVFPTSRQKAQRAAIHDKLVAMSRRRKVSSTPASDA